MDNHFDSARWRLGGRRKTSEMLEGLDRLEKRAGVSVRYISAKRHRRMANARDDIKELKATYPMKGMDLDSYLLSCPTRALG